MSVWIEGKVYDYGGTQIICLRRWFNGPMEMVDLASPTDPRAATSYTASVDDPPFAGVCVRTALALAPCVRPKVTNTLGGVLAPWGCDHRHYRHITADAGPRAGKVCCTACGGPVDASPR